MNEPRVSNNMELYRQGKKSPNAPLIWNVTALRLLCQFGTMGIQAEDSRGVYWGSPLYAYAWQLVDLGLLAPEHDPVPYDQSQASFVITDAGKLFLAAAVAACARSALDRHVADEDGAVWR